MNIEFNAERHEYRVNGLIVPSVTQVLSSVGLPDLSGIPAELLEWKAGLGSAVHKATELDDLGDLDEESLDLAIKPYLEAYRKFKIESGFVPLGMEEAVYSKKYGFAGRLDRVGFFGHKSILSLIDYKTGLVDVKTVGPQTSGYQTGWNEANETKDHIKARYALKLNKDATYRLIRLDNKMDFQIFLNALNIYKWRNQ